MKSLSLFVLAELIGKTCLIRHEEDVFKLFELIGKTCLVRHEEDVFKVMMRGREGSPEGRGCQSSPGEREKKLKGRDC